MALQTILGDVVKVAVKLVPPSDGATDRHVRAWRVYMAVMTSLTALGLSFHIALACGLLAPWYPGFASAAEVHALQEAAKQDRVTRLQVEILDLRQKQCRAEAGSEIKRLLTIPLQDNLQTYKTLTGVDYPLPACSDF